MLKLHFSCEGNRPKMHTIRSISEISAFLLEQLSTVLFLISFSRKEKLMQQSDYLLCVLCSGHTCLAFISGSLSRGINSCGDTMIAVKHKGMAVTVCVASHEEHAIISLQWDLDRQNIHSEK